MSAKPLNAIDGYSVSDGAIVVIYPNAHVAANSLNVTGLSNLGAIGNVTITGGSSGQVITTDGNGVLSFSTASSGGSLMPYFIPSGETYTIDLYKQGLFSLPIEIAGTLEVNGILVEVS